MNTDSDSDSNGQPSGGPAFVRRKLEDLRLRLLDLSGRNPLLGYKHPKGSSIRIVDELPDQVVEVLQSGRELRLEPLPIPTDEYLAASGYPRDGIEAGAHAGSGQPPERAWAREIGIRVEYEMPTGEPRGEQHQDQELQTLLYPERLEARLRAMRTKAGAAISEMGCNVLFLAVGFLEWYESPSSDRKRLAPLYTLPVSLERGEPSPKDGAFRYQIRHLDDDVLDNVTLAEALKKSFGLVLPKINEGEAPESFFERVRSTILNGQPRWRLHRYITLGVFNFHKQAMYVDLDAAQWPSGRALESHELVQAFFVGQDSSEQSGGDGAPVVDEYSIDHIKDVEWKYPLVFDADSSQHSAIIDAIEKGNLVIEGPPGTGKSQTITNLIAALIGAGKTVLFVAEKLAALEVVKGRLDRAGLGEFCLELHGHRAQKAQVLESVRSRCAASFRRPSQMQQEEAILSEYRDRLNQYAASVNERWRDTGLTIHEILSGAVRYRGDVGGEQGVPTLEGVGADALGAVARAGLRDAVARMGEVHRIVAQQAPGGVLASHYWAGVERADLAQAGDGELLSALDAWSASLEALAVHGKAACDLVGLSLGDDCSSQRLADVAGVASALPELDGTEVLGGVPMLARDYERAAADAEDFFAIHRRWDDLFEVLRRDDSLGVTVEQFGAALAAVTPLRIPMTSTVEELGQALQVLTRMADAAQNVESILAVVREHVPNQLQPCFVVSREGLGEYLRLREHIKSLPAGLWQYRSFIFDDPAIDEVLDDLSNRLERLLPMKEMLSGVVDVGRLPDRQTASALHERLVGGGVFRWFSRDWRGARRSLLAFSSPGASSKSVVASTELIAQYVTELDELQSAGNGLQALAGMVDGVDTPISELMALRKWYESVRADYGRGFGGRAAIAVALFELDWGIASGVLDTGGARFPDEVGELRRAIDLAARVVPGHALATQVECEILSEWGVADALERIEPALQMCEEIAAQGSVAVAQLESAVATFYEVKQVADDWEQLSSCALLRAVGFEMDSGPRGRNPAMERALLATLRLADSLRQSEALTDALEDQPTADRYVGLVACGQAIEKLVERESAARARFEASGGVDLAVWAGYPSAPIAAVLAKNARALERREWLKDWAAFLRVREQLIPQGLAHLVKMLESNEVAETKLDAALNAAVFKVLAEGVLEERADLREFFGPEHDGLRERFSDYDRRVMELRRHEVAARASKRVVPGGRRGGRVGDLTELALLEHEMKKQRGHISMRELLRRSKGAIRSLKPCFMMSPMSVATHLTPGEHEFDVVIMDEASQIKPEDAIGAIARGQRLVVVGDPKQLPPTTFFTKYLADEGDDEDDQVVLQDSESILDSVSGVFPTRRLRWHYRSRHESLIAFSNSSFYDGSLVLFPSPTEADPEFGIKFHRVSDGFFDEQVNRPEARAIVGCLVEQLAASPSESVGVVAMSAKQRDLIVDELEGRMRSDEMLRRRVVENEAMEEPLFIKNLETVQGDERDVVIISMTYGPLQPGGAVPQRFGPINSTTGWRRLNVLFTRAKKRMVVFSSMGADDVLYDAGASSGRKALSGFLAYCAGEHDAKIEFTSKPPDSDFEISVARRLESHGVGTVMQLGVAGYFLDIAVRDPSNPGRFLLGIECDGAAYHSAKSARDRDRLRQEVLEGLGWRILRIWSTDWFRNPDAQVQRVLNVLEQGQRSP